NSFPIFFFEPRGPLRARVTFKMTVSAAVAFVPSPTRPLIFFFFFAPWLETGFVQGVATPLDLSALVEQKDFAVAISAMQTRLGGGIGAGADEIERIGSCGFCGHFLASYCRGRGVGAGCPASQPEMTGLPAFENARRAAPRPERRLRLGLRWSANHHKLRSSL